MRKEQTNLDIRATQEQDGTVVHLKGEIDLRTSPELRGLFLELIDRKPRRIILDLTGVSYVDSSGVGTMVELKRRTIRDECEVVLVGLQPRVRSLFEITRLDKFFVITDNLDAAWQA